MRALLLHNPQAGAGGHTEKELLAALRLGGMKATYCSTKSDDFSDRLDQKADCYIVAGGDGTIAKVATQIRDRSRPIGLMPLGTANNVARSFGIAGTPQELSERYDVDALRRFDIGIARGPWGETRFVEAVGLGAIPGAMADKSTADKPSGSRKIIRGRRTLLQHLKRLDPVELDLDIDGVRHRDAYLSVEIMNTGSSGPALPLAPDADAGDGWLDVVMIRDGDRAAYIDWIEAPQDHVRDFGSVVRARRVSFSWVGGPLRIDDEVVEPSAEAHRVTIELEPVPVLVMGLSEARPAESDRETPTAA